jgi:hypothetical protein
MHCFRVHLRPNVIETIQEEIVTTAVDHPDGIVETGGWLWSAQDSNWWIDGLEVVEASGPGADAVKSYDELTLPYGHLRDLDLLFRSEGLEICGGWHLHPGRDDQPSEKDLPRIEKVLELRSIWDARTPRALEVIVTRRSDGRGLTATPWIFRHGSGGITDGIGPWPEAAYLTIEGETR